MQKVNPPDKLDISFVTSDGQTLSGENIKVPGFELIDFIFVQDGFFCRIYELATGMEVILSRHCTPSEIIADVIGQLVKKNVTAMALLKKILENQHQHGIKTLRVINPSPALIAYKEQQATAAANAPLHYNEQERAIIQSLIDQSQQENLPNLNVLQQQLAARDVPGSKYNIRPGIEEIQRIFQYARNKHRALLIRLTGKKLPDDLRDEYTPVPICINRMKQSINCAWKRDHTKPIPADILEKFYRVWALCWTKNNAYGYARFTCFHPQVDIARLSVDIKKGRDVSEDVTFIYKSLAKTYNDIALELIPYQPGADELACSRGYSNEGIN